MRLASSPLTLGSSSCVDTLLNLASYSRSAASIGRVALLNFSRMSQVSILGWFRKSNVTNRQKTTIWFWRITDNGKPPLADPATNTWCYDRWPDWLTRIDDGKLLRSTSRKGDQTRTSQVSPFPFSSWQKAVIDLRKIASNCRTKRETGRLRE